MSSCRFFIENRWIYNLIDSLLMVKFWITTCNFWYCREEEMNTLVRFATKRNKQVKRVEGNWLMYFQGSELFYFQYNFPLKIEEDAERVEYICSLAFSVLKWVKHKFHFKLGLMFLYLKSVVNQILPLLS